MKTRFTALLAAATLLLAACGDDDADTTAEPEQVETPADTPDDATPDDTPDDTPDEVTTADVLAAIEASGLGDILVDGAGLTLYGFTNDVDGVPSCYEACADAWPPILVESATLDPAAFGDGLDPAMFTTAERTDGTTQLVAGDWPLYLFAGDSAPGDVNGQASGDVWFVVGPDGALIGPADGEATSEDTPTDDTPAVTTAESGEGEILVDEDGLSLYGFTNDTNGSSSCFDACADAWPPVLTDGMTPPAGLDPAVFSTVDRGDGTYQLRAGDWPLYRFAGDAAAGDVAGQGSGGVWFLVAPDGSLIGN